MLQMLNYIWYLINKKKYLAFWNKKGHQKKLGLHINISEYEERKTVKNFLLETHESAFFKINSSQEN